MRLHSWSALVAAIVGLAPNALYLLVFLNGVEGSEAVYAGLIVLLLALPYIIAFGAAFSEQAAYRTASLTAALVAAIPPTLLLLAFFIGIILVPGVIALLVAAIRSGGEVRGLTKLGSFVVGVVAGVVLVIVWWPMITAYEPFYGSLSTEGVGTALGMVFVALTGLWLTGTALGRRSLMAA